MIIWKNTGGRCYTNIKSCSVELKAIQFSAVQWSRRRNFSNLKYTSYSKRLTSSPGIPCGPWEHSPHFIAHSFHFDPVQEHETATAALMSSTSTCYGSGFSIGTISPGGALCLKRFLKRIFGANLNPRSYSALNMRDLSSFTDRRHFGLCGHIVRLRGPGNPTSFPETLGTRLLGITFM